MHRRAAGFTLMELMIAVVVAAILAAIAVPNYSRYVLRSSRAVARGALIDLAAKQEVLKLQKQSYAATTSDLVGVGSNSYYIDRNGVVAASTTSGSIYKIALSVNSTASASCAISSSAGNFALTATPVAGSPQASDSDCTALCVSSTGLRGSSPKGVGVCWGQ